MTYFNYLKSLVEPQRGKQFGSLLKHLYETEFYFSIDNDGNRSEDGLLLRDEYCERYGDVLIPNPCCILEMLIGVSRRLEFIFFGSRYERPYGEWFWILIDNLGLEYFDNAQIDYLGLEEVNTILDIWMHRTYDRSGEGGLFPLRRAKVDQRKVEVWFQMMAWVAENYPI